MDIVILKTDIKTGEDFSLVKDKLSIYYNIQQCTIDLEDVDKVVRVIGDKIQLNDVVGEIKSLGFLCEELQD